MIESLGKVLLWYPTMELFECTQIYDQILNILEVELILNQGRMVHWNEEGLRHKSDHEE